MKYLMMVCAAFALLATGCGEEAAVQNITPKPPIDVKVVDSNELSSVLDANELTLIEFTADW